MKILVVGDLISDHYILGDATRICPEAPVPVVVPTREYTSPGGAGLVTAQLEELGTDVTFVPGSHSEKTRVFAGSHLICRIDRDASTRADPDDMSLIHNADAIVVSDYGKGAMTQGLAQKLVAAGKPLFVDAKHHWHWFAGSHVTIFPNHHEATPVIQNYPTELVRNEYRYGRVVSKMGKDGCRLNDDDYRDFIIPATTGDVVDTTGAGDIFMAGFVWAWSLGCPAEDCLRLANILAGESCRHRGTYVVPKAFAQAELDKIRASRVSQSRVPVNYLDSIPAMPPLHTLTALNPVLPQTLTGQTLVALDSVKFDIPLGGCDEEPAIRAVVLDTPHSAQTPPTVPLDPSTRLGVPAPLDQRIVDGIDKKWR